MAQFYQVDIQEIPREFEKFVRAIRVVGKTSLKSAQDIANIFREKSGGTIVAGVTLEIAEHISQELTRAGAVTSIVASTVRSPSSCNPLANHKFSWSKFRFLVAA